MNGGTYGVVVRDSASQVSVQLLVPNLVVKIILFVSQLGFIAWARILNPLPFRAPDLSVTYVRVTLLPEETRTLGPG